MLVTSVICIWAEYWLICIFYSLDISLFLVTQMWKERNWLNQSLEDCGRKVFKRLVCRSCGNYEVFFTFCMLERLESCMMWLRRKVLTITWFDKVCKEEVLRHVGEERTMISVIKRRQRVQLGHNLRLGDLVLLVIEGRMKGSKETTWKTLSENAGQSKGRQPLHSGQEACLRSRTIRKDLPVGRTHTHMRNCHCMKGSCQQDENLNIV